MTRQKCFAAALLLLVFCAGCKKIWPDKLYYTIQFDTDGGETYSYKETSEPSRINIFNFYNAFMIGDRYKIRLSSKSFHFETTRFSDGPFIFRVDIWPEYVDSSAIIDRKRYVIDPKTSNKVYVGSWYWDIPERDYYDLLLYGEFSFEKCKIEESDLSFSFFFECSMIKLYGHSTTDTLHITNGRLDVYKTLCEDNHYIVDSPQ